ncbi:MAG: hypothetical protein A3K19_22840 [Lentisphaerae bacterium RIFOXYB12_FULL_65_16]|nr:MAG: hypothetical protein A3K18_16915 [Lentisphaerae bacterium RIFOXYA12_64_32]OGV90048.1 MAG: hypothetical protein A3K19_22840 [Lentisphaerae bacterium RIFOXYB12_FULL_65_16]
MGMVTRLAFLLALVLAAAAPGQEGFREDFRGAASLAERGWRVAAEPAVSQWRLADDALEMTAFHAPYRGGRIEHDLPAAPAQGAIEFRVTLAVEGEQNFNHLCLAVIVGDFMTALKNYGSCTWLLHKGQGAWRTLSDHVPMRREVTFRVVYDLPARYAEFYCDNMDDPVAVDTDFHPTLQGPLQFMNYGLCTGRVVNRIHAVSVGSEAVAGVAVSPVPRAIVFQGLDDSGPGIVKAVAQVAPGITVHVYTVQTVGAAITPHNKFRLDRMPSRQRLREAELIVLADCPLTPDVFPDFLAANLTERVRGGGRLLITGGWFGLGKSGCRDAWLQDLLPVTLAGPWQVETLPAPVAVVGPVLTGQTLPAVTRLHRLALRDGTDARVLLSAGELPVWGSSAYGKGRVDVLLSVPDPAAPAASTAALYELVVGQMLK